MKSLQRSKEQTPRKWLPESQQIKQEGLDGESGSVEFTAPGEEAIDQSQTAEE